MIVVSITVDEENMGITDNPFCGCTLIDKDHEATEGVLTREQYLELLHVKVKIIMYLFLTGVFLLVSKDFKFFFDWNGNSGIF